MRNRIFMDVQEVMGLADKFSDYSQTLTSTIEEYCHSVSKMLESMEGSSKDSLEKASCNIQKEIQDAAGRFEGFSYIYKTTANARIKIDREAKEAAQAGIIGSKTGMRFGGLQYNTYGEQFSDMDSRKTYYYNISPSDVIKISVDFDLSIEEVIQILRGFHPQNVSNDMVLLIMDAFTKSGSISQSTIDEHRKNNVEAIGVVYSSGEYIENQGYWGAIKYGDYNMSYNGCGIIAMINAFHSLGIDLTDEEVAELIAEFEYYGCVNNGAWGTSAMAIAEYYMENTEYEVRCTTSVDSEDLKEVDENSDTFIVEVYNDGNSIYGGMHFVNIEKRVDENGDVKYIVHNAGEYDDIDKDGHITDDEYYEYDSLEEAIKAAGSKDNSEYVMVIGLNDPHKDDIKINEEDSIITDAPEKEEKTC